MKKLSLDEILALQLLGASSSQIMNQEAKVLKILNSPKGEEALDKASDILDRQEQLGITTLAYDDEEFPSQFRAVGHDCPPLIYLLGNEALLHSESFTAVIGARKASKAGIDAAFRLGKHFAEKGDVVVSGLAFGCDAEAHKGALAAEGATIAIVATGLDVTYPRENAPLQEKILESGSGLLLSEQIIGLDASPQRLVARNRLQAALSQKVVVAECPIKSGTMRTVKFAQAYGKQVLAYEFPFATPESSGNTHIISSGLGLPIKV